MQRFPWRFHRSANGGRGRDAPPVFPSDGVLMSPHAQGSQSTACSSRYASTAAPSVG